MTKYVPMINCGYCAGDTPMVWNLEPKLFDSEEECEEWILEHENGFSPMESEGGIYPYELHDEGIKFYQEHFKC